MNLKQKVIGKLAEYMVKNVATPPPISKLDKPLKDCTVAFVTTAGVHLLNDKPFDVKGDHTFRVIPADIAYNKLTITHDHYDKSEALKDINCVFPLEVLRDLRDEGYIKGVGPHHFGLMGYIPQTKLLIHETAPRIADMLEEDGVDITLFSPG